jgi:hypothetical protein
MSIATAELTSLKEASVQSWTGLCGGAEEPVEPGRARSRPRPGPANQRAPLTPRRKATERAPGH